MKHLPLLCLLLAPDLLAQSDSPEDEILKKTGIDSPRPPYEWLLQKPMVFKELLELRDSCSHYLNDSLFGGVAKQISGDSLYTLEVIDAGMLTGEKLIMRSGPGGSTASYYAFPDRRIESDSILMYEKYYPSGALAETGCTYAPECSRFTPFFGSDEPNSRFESYYENGQVKRSWNLYNGEPNGNEIAYYENGKVKEHRSYLHGIPAGKWYQYAPSGRRTGRLKFERGQGSGRWDGKKVSRVEF